jgi:hypothetical protein
MWSFPIEGNTLVGLARCGLFDSVSASSATRIFSSAIEHGESKPLFHALRQQLDTDSLAAATRQQTNL